jgi:hypothetical protein
MEGKPFALLDVNGNNNLAKLKDVVKEKQFSWRSFNNQRPMGQATISDEWNIRNWPTLYLIDAQGVIRQKWVGASAEKFLDRSIELLVADTASAQNK